MKNALGSPALGGVCGFAAPSLELPAGAELDVAVFSVAHAAPGPADVASDCVLIALHASDSATGGNDGAD